MKNNELLEILTKLYSAGSYDEEFPSKEAEGRVEKAHSAIIALMKKQIPEEKETKDITNYVTGNIADCYKDEFNERVGFNACIDQISQNIERLET